MKIINFNDEELTLLLILEVDYEEFNLDFNKEIKEEDVHIYIDSMNHYIEKIEKNYNRYLTKSSFAEYCKTILKDIKKINEWKESLLEKGFYSYKFEFQQ